MSGFRRLSLLSLGLSLGLLISGCSVLPSRHTPPGQQLDPWESWNRKVFNFNEGLDEHLLRPTATAYAKVVPSGMRTAVDNFFNNFSDAWSAVNLVLQGKPGPAVQQTMRFAVNTTLGLGGLIDIATPAGIERDPQDLGRTLGHWGFGTGAYIVWPLLGPSSVRDSIGLPFDLYVSPSLAFNDGKSKVAIYALHTVNARSNLLGAKDMLDGIALDKYTFYRDAYLTLHGSIKDVDADNDDFEVITPDAAAPAASAASAAAPAPASAASAP